MDIWLHGVFFEENDVLAWWPRWMIEYVLKYDDSSCQLAGREIQDLIEYNGFLTEC